MSGDGAATSATQYLASESRRIPAVEEIADEVWAIPMVLPVDSPPYSLCYATRDSHGSVHLIDPGWNLQENWVALTGWLSVIGRSPDDIASVTVTHMHPDHIGLAERIRSASGASVALGKQEQEALDQIVADGPDVPNFHEWGVPADRIDELAELATNRRQSPLTADRQMVNGDLLDVPGRRLRTMHTPGHTVGHIVVEDPDLRILFTGDHILPKIHPGVGLGGRSADPLRDYLESLDALLQFPDHEVQPGHGYGFRGLVTRVDETRQHHERRTREVEVITRAAPGLTVWDVASRVTWTDGWSGLRARHLGSALAQTAMRMAYLK